MREADSLTIKSIELYQVKGQSYQSCKIVEERINKTSKIKPKEFETN